MRSFLVALMLAALISMTGCAIGLRSYNTDVGDTATLKQSLKDSRIAYRADDDMLRLALEKALIESYHVQDMLPVQKIEGNQEIADRVVINAAILPKPLSTWANVCFAISYFSFSTIPCVCDETRDVVLSATLNQKVIRTKSYRIKVRSYNWFPLSLAGADYYFVFIAGGDIAQQEKEVSAYGEVMRDFLPGLAVQREGESL